MEFSPPMLRRCLPQFALLTIFALLSSAVHSRTPPTPGPAAVKESKDYFSVGFHYNQFKSIELILDEINSDGSIESAGFKRQFPLTATTYALSAAYGTYINNTFFTEIRYGRGIISDKLDSGALEVNIEQWMSWYMGASYGLTDYATVFAKYGLSFFAADVTRYETKQFRLGAAPPNGETISTLPSRTQMEEELFGENFSTSWLVGVDFEVVKDIYWSWEYGRLLNDADSGIKVYQFSTLVKYEF